MKLLPLDRIRPGEKLGRSIYFKNGVVMLRKGVAVNDSYRNRLKNRGVRYLLVYDEDTEDIQTADLIPGSLRTDLRSILHDVFHEARQRLKEEIGLDEFFESVTAPDQSIRDIADKITYRVGSKVIPTNLKEAVTELINELPIHDEALRRTVIPPSQEMWLMDHSIDVASWSLLTARLAGFSMAELKKIGLGALLHDIGYMLLPTDNITSMDEIFSIGDDERRTHPMLGYVFLRSQDTTDLLSAHMAYQHHENIDGSGYPRGLKGVNRLITDKKEALRQNVHSIHRFSHVIATVDTYSRRVQGLPDRDVELPDRVRSSLRRMAGNRLNRESVQTFLNLVPPFPISTPVQATSGELRNHTGVVADLDAEAPHQPTVRFLYHNGDRLSEPFDVNLQEEDVNIQSVRAPDTES